VNTFKTGGGPPVDSQLDDAELRAIDIVGDQWTPREYIQDDGSHFCTESGVKSADNQRTPNRNKQNKKKEKSDHRCNTGH